MYVQIFIHYLFEKPNKKFEEEEEEEEEMEGQKGIRKGKQKQGNCAINVCHCICIY